DCGFDSYAILSGRAITRQSDLRFAEDIGDGRAEFVGEVGRKLREPREGIVEPLQHGVESDGERLKLARPAGGGHALVQMSRSDSSERTRHFSERTQTAFGDGDRNQSRGKNAEGKHNSDQRAELLCESIVGRPILCDLDGVRLTVRLLDGCE